MFVCCCQFHYLPVGGRAVQIVRCSEYMDLTNGHWSREETSKLILFVYSMLTSPKKTLFYIFLMRGI